MRSVQQYVNITLRFMKLNILTKNVTLCKDCGTSQCVSIIFKKLLTTFLSSQATKPGICVFGVCVCKNIYSQKINLKYVYIYVSAYISLRTWKCAKKYCMCFVAKFCSHCTV
jgi:hypothetical protein